MQMLCSVYPNIVLFFREEGSLVEQFVFEVLVVFVESLALAHFDEKSLGKKLNWTFFIIKTSCLMVMTIILAFILLLSTQELSSSVVAPLIIWRESLNTRQTRSIRVQRDVYLGAWIFGFDIILVNFI